MLGTCKNRSKASKDFLPSPCKLAGFGSPRSQKKVETAWPNGQLKGENVNFVGLLEEEVDKMNGGDN